jgi:hypothetical protein
MFQGSVLFDAVLLFEKKREREKKRAKRLRGFFPREDTLYWLCHTRIFLADRCN